ncbi:hypothetical protein BU25DRAFT_300669, partial [Macroventuria anomochaeta]
YASRPLDLESDQIRLLEVHHGRREELIYCSIRTVCLQDQPLYATFSYVWGNPGSRRAISIDDQALILRLLVVTLGEQLVFWIDAICIDQSSHAERSHHVAMMGEIYSQCTEAIVWLGE